MQHPNEMRLTTHQIDVIRETVHTLLGNDAEVTLFGSRVDDTARGGDIDLMVTVPAPLERPAVTAARVATTLERRLDGRHVDVVLVTPDTTPQPIHDLARRQGIQL